MPKLQGAQIVGPWISGFTKMISALLKESDVIRNTDVALQKRIYFNNEIRNEIPSRKFQMRL